MNNTRKTLIAPIKTDTYIHAERFLINSKQAKEINDELDKDKVWLREKADGETLNEVVPGLGSVQVKKPGGGGAFTNYGFSAEEYEKLSDTDKKFLLDFEVVKLVPQFNHEKFLALFKQQQNKLYTKKVVTVTSGFNAPSSAAVTATLNK